MTFDVKTDKWCPRVDVPLPTPTSGQVRVKVLAVGLNPVDAKVASWKGMIIDGDAPVVVGLDVCGIVDALGPGVSDTTVDVGELVVYHGNMRMRAGGLAEYALHDALTLVNLDRMRGVATLPDAVTLAGAPCAAWTAYRALHDKLRLTPDDRFAVVGAAGGVGSFALQIAKLAGCKQVIAVCSERNVDYCLSLGATQCVTREQLSGAPDGGLGAALRRVTGGGGVDRLLDCVGEATTTEAYQSLAYDGIVLPLVSVGTPTAFGMQSFLSSHCWAQLALGGAHAAGEAARSRLRVAGEAVTRLVCAGKLRVPVERVLEAHALEVAAEALVGMLKADTRGKIVLRMVAETEIEEERRRCVARRWRRSVGHATATTAVVAVAGWFLMATIARGARRR